MILDNSTNTLTTEVKIGVNIYDQGLVSVDYLITFYQYKALGIVLSVSGIFASLMSIVVNLYLRQDAYVVYLIGVAFWDNMFLFTVFIGSVFNVFFPVSSQPYECYSLYVSSFGSVVFRRTAVVLNGLSASERFFKLVFPFKTSRTILSSYPRRVILFIFIVCVLGHLPLVLELEVKEITKSVWMVVATRLQQDNYNIFLILRNASRVVFFYLPIVYSLGINLALVAALKHHTAKQRNIRATRGRPQVSSAETNSQTEALVRTSLLVLIISGSFFLLALPSTVNATLSSFLADYGFFSRNRYLCILLSHLVEWIVYLTQPCSLIACIVLSRHFRKSFFRKFYEGLCRRQVLFKKNC